MIALDIPVPDADNPDIEHCVVRADEPVEVEVYRDAAVGHIVVTVSQEGKVIGKYDARRPSPMAWEWNVKEPSL